MGHAEHLMHLGREGGEAVREALPVARDRLSELREQAQAVLRGIEDIHEQAQPAIEEGKKSAAHGASAVSLASQISPKRRRSKFPFVLVILLVAGGAAYAWWNRRFRSGTAPAYHSDLPGTETRAL
jgi:ferric-dicitrate binding protein FerR (iron transport regulator)